MKHKKPGLRRNTPEFLKFGRACGKGATIQTTRIMKNMVDAELLFAKSGMLRLSRFLSGRLRMDTMSILALTG